jgi:hypothetical protein
VAFTPASLVLGIGQCHTYIVSVDGLSCNGYSITVASGAAAICSLVADAWRDGRRLPALLLANRESGTAHPARPY